MKLKQHIKTLLVSTLLFTSIAFGQSPYVVNGNAYSTSCDCYTLTNAQNWLVGSVWNANQLNLTNSFDMTFDVFLGCTNGGADGMVFGLQPVGTNIGASGGGMGMGGVSPSLGVFIDTYENGSDFDPPADHLSVQTNGDIAHDNSPDDLTPAIPLPNIEDCNYHSLQVIWDATFTQLTVYVDGILYVNILVDMVNTVFSGNPNVYWGFTAATGGLNNVHKFCIQSDLLLELSSDTTCINQAITMADSSIIAGGIVTRQWDFGDGSPFENTQNVTHSYAVPGTYTVSLDLTDVSGCIYTVTNDIEVLEPVLTQLVTNSACNACTGEIEIEAAGSVGPYQYSSDGGTFFQLDSVFGGLCGSQIGQIYNLVVIDQFGCQNTVTDTVFDDKPQIDTVVLVDSDCQNNTGEVSIGTSTIGGSAPYTYSIAGLTGFQSLPITNLPPNAPSTYNLIVEDGFGCTDTAAVSIDITNEPSINPIIFVNESCTGICDGSATLTGINLVNYSIDNGQTYGTSGTFNNLCAGVYDVIVNNDFGCELFDQFTITKPSTAVAEMEANIINGCAPLAVEFSNLSSGQIAKTEWSFSDGTTISVAGPGNVNHNFNSAGLQDITITLTTIDGCIFQEYYTSYIDVFATPKAGYTHLPEKATIYNTEVEYTNASSNDVSNWLWNFGAAAVPSASIAENPTVIYPEGIEATYPVELIVSNDNGCDASIKGTVNVVSDVSVYSANTFIPTSNQNNPGWRIYISGIDNYSFHLTLFNRWGEIVWESFDPTAVWDGTYSSGELVPEGTFIWYVQSRDIITDKIYEFRGTVTVLK